MDTPGLNHKGTVELETVRLILRPFKKNDDVFMYNNWASDPDVPKYMMWPVHKSIKDSRAVLSQWLKSQRSIKWYNWAIVSKDLGTPIGSIGIYDINDRARCGEIGYCIGKAWWGNGIMPEAFRAIRDFMFDTVGLQKIKGKYCVENPNSGKVMVKCGMLHEGTARLELADGESKLHDAEIYGMLKTDERK